MTKIYTDNVDDVNMQCVDDSAYQARMDAAARLKRARIDAGYTKSAMGAAKARGWPPSTYAAHENGQNAFDEAAARKYARAFRVNWLWLLYGEGPQKTSFAPIVGKVGAGAEVFIYGEPQGPIGEVPLAPDEPENTVAVEVTGDSMYPSAAEGWLVLYADRPGDVGRDAVGTMSVVGLADGRILVKWLHPGSIDDRYNLISSNAAPMLNQKVEWASKVLRIKPR